MANYQRRSELAFLSRSRPSTSSSRSPAGGARQVTESETTESPVSQQTPPPVAGARAPVRGTPNGGAGRSLESLNAKMGELQKSNERIELVLKELQETSTATKGREKLPKELSVSTAQVF